MIEKSKKNVCRKIFSTIRKKEKKNMIEEEKTEYTNWSGFGKVYIWKRTSCASDVTRKMPGIKRMTAHALGAFNGCASAESKVQRTRCSTMRHKSRRPVFCTAGCSAASCVILLFFVFLLPLSLFFSFLFLEPRPFLLPPFFSTERQENGIEWHDFFTSTWLPYFFHCLKNRPTKLYNFLLPKINWWQKLDNFIWN